MSTLHRIKAYLEFKGISNQKFEKSIGLSNGAFGNQLKNNRTIGVDKLEKVLSAYKDINPTWLLTGEGEMIKTVEGGNPKDVDRPRLLDVIGQLKEKELNYQDRLELADHLLARLMDLSEENSRLKSELLQAYGNMDHL